MANAKVLYQRALDTTVSKLGPDDLRVANLKVRPVHSSEGIYGVVSTRLCHLLSAYGMCGHHDCR